MTNLPTHKRFRDLTGEIIGRWKVIAFAGKRGRGQSTWECECQCESKTHRIVTSSTLLNATSQSCGCLSSESSSARFTKHGQHQSAEHRIWRSMRQRCENPNHISFPNYGGRGIVVCDRWSDFAAFLSAMGPRPSASHQIDRKDVNGNYEPDNCRWATIAEQHRNTRRTVMITLNGESMCKLDWCIKLGIPKTTLTNRLARGWSVERALTTPVQKHHEREADA